MVIRHYNIIKRIADQKNMQKKDKDHYNIFFDFETITNGVKHEPYLCWVYNNDIQQQFIGINTCAQDMSNALLTDKKQIL